jgi:hypothetical protein
MDEDFPEDPLVQHIHQLECQVLAHRLLLQQLLVHRLLDWRNPDEALGLRAICDAELRDWTRNWPRRLEQPYLRGGEEALAEIDAILDFAREVSSRTLSNDDDKAQG